MFGRSIAQKDRDEMKLVVFILKFAPSSFVISIVGNVLSGMSTAGLIFVVNAILTGSVHGTSIFVGVFMVLVVTILLTRAVAAYVTFGLTHKIILQLRGRLASLILRAPLEDLEKVKASTLLAAFTEDVNVIVNSLPGIPTVALNAAIIAGCFLYMIWLYPPTGLIALILLVVTAFAYERLTRRASAFFVLAQKSFDVMFAYFRALTEGIKELKLNRERRNIYVSQVFLPEAYSYRNHMLSGSALHYIAHILVYTVILASLGAMIFIFHDSDLKEVAIGYALILLFIGAPIETILLWVPAISRANIALDNINSLSTQLSVGSPEIDAVDDATRQLWSTLELRDLTFTYPSEGDEKPFTLGPLNLTITQGDIIFIVGGNGSGKSTLVKILCALYRPTSGKIIFGGIAIDDTNREWYRQHFSVVFADAFLFDRLFAFAHAGLSDQVEAILARLRLNRIVKVNASGVFSTTALSHGQRKRLALLVAFLENRPIYIFDELAADQDPEFKKTFYLELLPQLKEEGKTVLVVTHDWFHGIADRVLRLDGGQLTDWRPPDNREVAHQFPEVTIPVK
jgi:putative ATP-binding cassette transporter